MNGTNYFITDINTTKSLTSKVLLETSSISQTSYTLSDNISNYDYLLIELVKSEEYRNTAYDSFCSSLNDEKTDVGNYTCAYGGGNNYWETGSLEIDDELYFYVFATYYNPVIEVWDECGEWILHHALIDRALQLQFEQATVTDGGGGGIAGRCGDAYKG
jgi:hypothetical protein